MPDRPLDPTSPSPESTPIPPLDEFDGYRIERQLGRGGMGVVYLALQLDLNRRVALKMLTGRYSDDELQRFREESETAAGLSHNNIAHVYEVGEHNGAPYFSMEFVEAGSLADQIRQQLPEPRDAAKLLLDVARAIHYAHLNGVIHRDLKPANILLDEDGTPKVADFGIAKRVDGDSQLTHSGVVIGTPTYMAPEQARGDSRHVGPAADVYSLGAILYEMLAGRPPFLPEDNQTALTVRVLTEEPVSPAWHRPGIPRDLETICLKCLEKEPRERYADAGALAEDLRRFLADESILAKPPGRVVKSVKWIRKHPWKFIAAAAITVLFIAGIARLAQWELYQRPHIEYSATVVWVNGGLEPIEKISADAATHRAGYLRLTRQGRFGPIVKVEALNARGNPAVLRRILSDELIPLYLEGLAGAQVYSETRPETTTVEFEYAGRTATEATGRDRNGQVNWRLLYDHLDPRTHTVQARFVNLQGFDSTSREGASHLEFERDPQGRDHRVTFFNGVGQPAANGEGVYGYELDHDRPGHITKLVNLGADGAPAANRAGLIGYAATFGKDVRYDVRDGAGQPATWNGIAAIISELDSAGNLVRSTSLGPDGKPESSSATAYSVQDLKRNDHGELIQRVYSKAQPDGSLKEVNRTDISYDEFGHPADLRNTATGATGPNRTAWNNDRNGNITEERSLDPTGKPITGEQGYAIRRFSYSSGPQGLTVEETYFDANGGKVYCKSGYHRTITEFSASGTLRRQIFDEHDPAQYPYYRRSSVPEFDAQGRLHRLTIRYEDARGELTTSAEIPYVVSDNTYDEQGHVVTEWLTARDPQAFGGALIRTDTEWYPGAGMKRRVRQVYDANRQPVPVIPTGSAARKEEEFDSTGDPERIYETGFDEQLMGFGSREARFSAGAFLSVVHKRNDGSTLDSVRVLISGVVPPEDQPRSAELHAGDQLVAANGKPVTSAYAWVFGGPFPGGWIEVLRNGQRIRIDGFKPGKLGIYLDERGPAVK